MRTVSKVIYSIGLLSSIVLFIDALIEKNVISIIFPIIFFLHFYEHLRRENENAI